MKWLPNGTKLKGVISFIKKKIMSFLKVCDGVRKMMLIT